MIMKKVNKDAVYVGVGHVVGRKVITEVWYSIEGERSYFEWVDFNGDVGCWSQDKLKEKLEENCNVG
jgi:hypothetical protein